MKSILGVLVKLTEELVLNVHEVLCVANSFTVGILDTMLVQDSTTPVITTAHNLGPNRALVAARLVGQRSQRVVNIITTRILGPLDRNQILVLVCATLHEQPVHIVTALVLVALDKVPSEDEVLCDVIDGVSNQTHGDIVPGHATELSLADFVALPVLHALEIHDTVVVEFLSGEDIVAQAGWVNICKWMLVGVPSAETEINPTNECEGVVNDDELLVMRLKAS